jgi:acyl-CoA dehydrogenase
VELLKVAGITHLPGGLKVEEFDYLHTLIYTDEVGEIDRFPPFCGGDTDVHRWHE